MKVVFRVDASLQIGTGHVMRCLTLADTLRTRGADCRFICRKHEGNLIDVICSKGYDVHVLPNTLGQGREPASTVEPRSPNRLRHSHWLGATQTQDAEASAIILESLRPDWLVVDHYALDARWEESVATYFRKLLVIDDLADRPHIATLLLDQNLGRLASDYDGLVPAECRRLTGPYFALLRPEFAARRADSLARREGAALMHLLISMGGTDIPDATSTVLRALANAVLPTELRISVVMGSRAPSLSNVRELAATMPWPTEVLVDVHDMASLMADADLAIGAGGSTTWERCCLGLPSIMIETAANQAGAVAAMEKIRAALGTGSLSHSQFASRLVAAVSQAIIERDTLSACSAGICDGQGTQRVADMILANQLTVRASRLEDAKAVWHWRQDSGPVAFQFNPSSTTLADHLTWFAKALVAEERDLLIVEVNGQPAAHVRFDHYPDTSGEATISICLNPAFRGRGLGTSILDSACAHAFANGSARIVAKIHRDNIASLKIFRHAGFTYYSNDGNFDRFIIEAPSELPHTAIKKSLSP